MNDALNQFLQNGERRELHAPQARPVSSFIALVLPSRSHAFSYSHLYSLELGDTIELTFTDHVVSLHGNNLESLFWSVQRHTVDRVVCVDELHAKAKGSAEFVSSIVIQRIGEQEQ